MSKEDKEQYLISIGEMARLCRTTKDTLYFYERKGLLTPKVTNKETGYRYYDADNFYLMDMVLALREAESSVKEIQAWMDHPVPEFHIDMLEKKGRELEEKIRDLTILQKRIESSVRLTREGMSSREGIVKIEKQPVEYLSIIYVKDQDDPSDYIPAFFELLKKAKSKCIPYDFHVSAMISEEHLKDKDYNADYFYVASVEPVEGPDIWIKPEGTYITTTHFGPYTEISRSYHLLFKEIEQRDIHFTGPAYEESQICWINSDSREHYRTKISVRID